MEHSSPPFVLSSDSDAAPWVQLLLAKIGLPASAAAELIVAAMITTTGALRDLHSRPAEWKAFLEPLSAAVASELGVDREDARQALIEGFDEALEAVQIKRPRTEEAGPGPSSTPTQAATAGLQPPTVESEELLRTKQWCSTQPIIVSHFVRRVLPPDRASEKPRNPYVVCTCGHKCWDFHFRSHVVSGKHEREFFALLDQSEALGAKAAVLRVAEMVSDLEQRATSDQLAATALRGEVSVLQSRLVALEAELDTEKRAHCRFENRYTAAQARLDAQAAVMRSFTSPTARLHQELWQRGLFDMDEHPLNHTLDELHRLSLVRVGAGDDVKKGGAGLHLTPTASALAPLLHAKTNASGYRLMRDVFRWLPSPDDVRRLPSFEKGGPFVAIGCHQREWGEQAFRFYDRAGYNPRTEPFGICFDPAKIMAEITWDQKTNGFVGHIDFDSNLSFRSWQDMEHFFAHQVAAGYVIPFLICPLNPRFPSAFMPVGVVLSNLTYTTGDIDRFLGQIRSGLLAASFGYVVPTTAFDNPSVHRKFALLSGNPRGFPGDRASGGSLGAELLDGDDAILTLGAYRRTGSTIETIVTIDEAHTVKNNSLQMLHLSRLLTLGNYVMLIMMLVAVRVEAGLHAGDVNGSDPMDVSAAERRLNVRTRCALAKHPESFGLLVYLWAMACGRAAWLDRDPQTTPLMRVGWAFNNLVFIRWWLDWIEVSGKPADTHFISMETHAANDISDQMLIHLVLLWGRYFSDRPFAPWLVGSDQNEHLNNELRSMRINQPDWTSADVLRLMARFIHMLVLLTQPGVHLPKVFSNKGFNRSAYTPSAEGEHVHSFPTLTEIIDEYWASVRRVRPLFVALGAAKALREAGRWHAPSLEEWASIEKACDVQAAAFAEFERQANSDKGAEEEEQQEGEGEGDDADDGAEELVEDDGDEEETEFFPERIIKDRLKPGQRAEFREYLIKWRGWSDAEEDLSWEAHSQLAVSNPQLVWKYVQGVRRTGKSLKIDKPNDDELKAAALADASDEGEAAGDEPATPPPPPQQPEIDEAVDRRALLALLTERIGGEQPNGVHSKAQKPDATAAQRAAYEASHVENEETGQNVHKRAALAFWQKQLKDAKPGAGHQQRYVTGERQPIIAEDKDGTGFGCDEYYQVHIGDSNVTLNSDAELMLEGALHVGYARVLELRKLNGKRRVPRLSVRAKDASRCSAVILPLVVRDGRWVADRSVASPVLVPLLSLGRRVIVTEGSGARSGSFSVTAADFVAGGPQLHATYLTEDLFAASAMRVVEKDLMAMKVAELKEELEAREEAKSGNKAWLRRRLHATIVREHLEACDEEQ